MKAQKVKDLLTPCAEAPGALSYGVAEYLNLLANAVDVKAGGESLRADEQAYLKRQLFVSGQIGYHALTEGFYRVSAMGRKNRLGNYEEAEFMTENGYSFQVPISYEKDGSTNHIVKALPIEGCTFYGFIMEAASFMRAADVARRQNLEATKTPYIVVCRDADTRLSIKQAIEQKESGQAAIVVSGELGDAIKGVSIEVPYLVDKFDEAMDMERNKLLSKLGILTANTNKRERVQSAEVNATLGEATDYIYMLIDFFNKQMESYGLPYSMEYNGSMEELYEDGSGTPVNDQEENQTAEVEND